MYITALFDLLRWRIARYWFFAALIALAVPAGLWIGLLVLLKDLHNLADGYINIDSWFVSIVWTWLVGLLIGVGVFFTSYAFSILLLLVLGFFTGPIVRKVVAIHYPWINFEDSGGVLDDFIEMLSILGRYLLILVGLAALSIFLLPFAPLMFGLWGWMLFRRLLLCDVGGQLLPATRRHAARRGYWVESMAAYLLSLIPVVNLIAPIYGVLLVAHAMIRRQSASLSEQRHIPVITPEGDEISGD